MGLANQQSPIMGWLHSLFLLTDSDRTGSGRSERLSLLVWTACLSSLTTWRGGNLYVSQAATMA